jgi:amino acid permease
MLGVSVHQCNTSWLYLNTKDLIPGKPESMYEIGYMLFNRSSIFFISGIIVLNAFGLVMVYFIVFSKIMASICMDALGVKTDDEGLVHYMATKQFWVLSLSILMLPVIIKKELQELHIVSVMLFAAVCIFIFIVFLQLVIFGTNEFSEGTPYDLHQFSLPAATADFYTIVKSLCCMFVAFAFTQNLFPVYSALKVKTN